MDRRPFLLTAADRGTVRRLPLFCFRQPMEARMEGEKEMVRDTTEGSGEQQAITSRDEPNPVGQDSPENEFGEIGGTGSAPPRSMGTRGGEFGQFNDQDESDQQGQSG